MRRLITIFEKLSKLQTILSTSAILLFITLLDYLTGYEISFTVFYLFPIALITWSLGRNYGILFSLLGSILQFFADYVEAFHYTSASIPYWNATVRCTSFLIVTLILAYYKKARLHEGELNQFIIHDLRSPLAAIKSSLELLNNMFNGSSDKDKKELIELSIDSGESMMKLINSMLDVNKFEERKMKINLKQVEIGRIIDSAIKQTLIFAKNRGIQIDVKQSEEVKNVFADEALTDRVLVNLLNNAIKFSEENSKISITVEANNEHQAVISIADQGKGIPKEWEKKVFEKFNQVNFREETGQGSGLGLTFCKYAVNAQKGKIWINSVPNVGTTILFTLPIDKY